MKKGDNLCLTSVSFSSEIHFQFLGFGPGLFCGSEAWSRRLACSTCGGGRKQSWPLFSLNLFFSFFYCFSPTSGILRKVKFCLASYFGITRRNIKKIIFYFRALFLLFTASVFLSFFLSSTSIAFHPLRGKFCFSLYSDITRRNIIFYLYLFYKKIMFGRFFCFLRQAFARGRLDQPEFLEYLGIKFFQNT